MTETSQQPIVLWHRVRGGRWRRIGTYVNRTDAEQAEAALVDSLAPGTHDVYCGTDTPPRAGRVKTPLATDNPWSQYA